MVRTIDHGEVVALIPAMKRFARQLCRQPCDADDLVQTTVLKAIANLEKFEPDTRLKSWMFTIMRNACYTRAKKLSRETVGVSDALEATLFILPAQDWALAMYDMSEAIERLPSENRETLIQIAVHGESYEDAAIRFGCAVGTVKSRLSRAREKLRTDFLDSATPATADMV